VTAQTLPPGSAYCQRWQGRRGSWRHPSDGGFDARRFRVCPVPRQVAQAFVVTHHYAASMPADRWCFGLTTDDPALGGVDPLVHDGRAVVGAAVLSVPMSQAVLSNVFPTLAPYVQSLELGRLVLLDPVPANAESWFVARVFRLAADAGIRGVVSFCDPMPRRRLVTVDGRTDVELVTPGHVGLVYQALGAAACGRSTARTLTYLPSRGEVLSDRTLQKIRAQESGGDAAEQRLVRLGARARRAGEDPRAWLRGALVDLGAASIRHPGNYRYAWSLGPRRERAPIALPSGPYPKPSTGRIAVPAPAQQLAIWL
jgi:hypothetical protein